MIPVAEEERLLPGCLYVVATPIGNLGDLSPRALRVLSQVDALCAEDTRTTAQLLSHFGVAKPMKALHDHNETRIAAYVVAQLQSGKTLALVSDAGTPLVSDPGYALVDAARSAGLTVQAIPGPCAVTTALSMAGLPTDEFLFAGFMPAKPSARRARLQALAAEPRTWVTILRSDICMSARESIRLAASSRPQGRGLVVRSPCVIASRCRWVSRIPPWVTR